MEGYHHNLFDSLKKAASIPARIIGAGLMLLSSAQGTIAGPSASYSKKPIPIVSSPLEETIWGVGGAYDSNSSGSDGSVYGSFNVAPNFADQDNRGVNSIDLGLDVGSDVSGAYGGLRRRVMLSDEIIFGGMGFLGAKKDDLVGKTIVYYDLIADTYLMLTSSIDGVGKIGYAGVITEPEVLTVSSGFEDWFNPYKGFHWAAGFGFRGKKSLLTTLAEGKNFTSIKGIGEDVAGFGGSVKFERSLDSILFKSWKAEYSHVGDEDRVYVGVSTAEIPKRDSFVLNLVRTVRPVVYYTVTSVPTVAAGSGGAAGSGSVGSGGSGSSTESSTTTTTTTSTSTSSTSSTSSSSTSSTSSTSTSSSSSTSTSTSTTSTTTTLPTTTTTTTTSTTTTTVPGPHPGQTYFRVKKIPLIDHPGKYYYQFGQLEEPA